MNRRCHNEKDGVPSQISPTGLANSYKGEKVGGEVSSRFIADVLRCNDIVRSGADLTLSNNKGRKRCDASTRQPNTYPR